ncbi:MAG: ankyrin repeat domain-containing protein [Candidatus Zixiibacteriota bacterium]
MDSLTTILGLIALLILASIAVRLLAWVFKERPSRPQSDLLKASFDGQFDRVLELVNSGINIDCANGTGKTPLMYASAGGHQEIVDYFIERGSSINALTRSGVSALMLASEAGHVHIVKRLIEAGAELNTVDDDFISALSMAIGHGYGDVVSLLLDAGADVDNCLVPDRLSPLCSSIAKGRTDWAEKIISMGADVNSADDYGTTALMGAAAIDMVDIVRILLDGGADANVTNRDGRSALDFALENASSRVIEILQDTSDAD